MSTQLFSLVPNCQKVQVAMLSTAIAESNLKDSLCRIGEEARTMRSEQLIQHPAADQRLNMRRRQLPDDSDHATPAARSGNQLA